jgi:hypothetical protein
MCPSPNVDPVLALVSLEPAAAAGPADSGASAVPPSPARAEDAAQVDEIIGELPPVLLRDGAVPRLCRVEAAPGGLLLRPVGGFARLSGEVVVPIRLDAVRELQLDGPELLLVGLGPRLLRIEGPGAGPLGRWLAAATGADLDRRVWVEGEVSCWGPSGATGRSARLQLSGRTLSLRDGRRTIEIAVDDLLGVQFLGPQLRVELSLRPPSGAPVAGVPVPGTEDGWTSALPGGGRRLVLGGGLSLGLFGALSALIPGPRPEPAPLFSWPAARAKAPAGEDGVLELTISGVAWRAGSDPAGTPAFSARWEAVERAVVHGEAPRRLSLVVSRAGCERQIHAFLVADPEAALRALTAVLHQAQRAFALELSRAHRAVEQVASRWASILSAPGSAVKLQSLALRVVGLDVNVGLVVLAHDRLWFLPAGGRNGTSGADDWATSDVVRVHEADPGGHPSVRFEAEGRSFRLIPAADEVFVGRFWDRCRAPTRIVRGARPVAMSLARMEGQPRQIRVRGPDGAWSVRQPGLLVGLDRGIGLLLDEDMAPVAAGTVVAVEVGRQEGVYEFSAFVIELRRISGRALAAAGLPAQPEGEHRLLVVACPAELRLYNQRRSFRVSVDLEAHAIVEPKPQAAAQRLPLRIDDLSTGGCGAWGPGALEVGMGVELLLALPERSLRASARVLRADPPRAGAPDRRRYGLCFEGLSLGDEERIHRVVMATQGAALQAQLADRA